jgi:hypothetical protein
MEFVHGDDLDTGGVRRLVHIDIPYDPGFHAPCPLGLDALAGDARLDIHVVPDWVLSSSGLPALVLIEGAHVRGRVVERTDPEVRPVRGAALRLVSDTELLWSSTQFDASGKFLLCSNVPADRHTLHAKRDGYRAESRSISIAEGDNVRARARAATRRSADAIAGLVTARQPAMIENEKCSLHHKRLAGRCRSNLARGVDEGWGPRVYSYRSASTGSIRLARCAGMSPAAADTAVKSSRVIKAIPGSCG